MPFSVTLNDIGISRNRYRFRTTLNLNCQGATLAIGKQTVRHAISQRAYIIKLQVVVLFKRKVDRVLVSGLQEIGAILIGRSSNRGADEEINQKR